MSGALAERNENGREQTNSKNLQESEKKATNRGVVAVALRYRTEPI